MPFKIINKRGQRVFPQSFSTKAKAKAYLATKERIVGKMPSAKIVQYKKRK